MVLHQTAIQGSNFHFWGPNRLLQNFLLYQWAYLGKNSWGHRIHNSKLDHLEYKLCWSQSYWANSPSSPLLSSTQQRSGRYELFEKLH